MALGLYWLILCVSTHLPRVPNLQICGRDKTLHFAAYAVLTLVFWLVKYRSIRPNFRHRGIYITFLIVGLYGAADEITQSFVHRSCDPLDWLCDMSGAATAILAIWLMRRPLHWLIAYWLGMVVITHWPVNGSAFLVLPTFWQQFQVAYMMGAYLILTLLFWRTLCQESKFVYNPKILTITLLVLPLYTLADESINAVIGRGFDYYDFCSGIAGILLGIVCASLLARHHTDVTNHCCPSQPFKDSDSGRD